MNEQDKFVYKYINEEIMITIEQNFIYFGIFNFNNKNIFFFMFEFFLKNRILIF